MNPETPISFRLICLGRLRAMLHIWKHESYERPLGRGKASMWQGFRFGLPGLALRGQGTPETFDPDPTA